MQSAQLPIVRSAVVRFSLCSFLQFRPILLDKSIKAYRNRATGVNVVSVGSPSRILIVRRISFGMTTLPRSSILRTIPVAFIYINPPNFHFSRIFCDGNNYIVRAFGGFMQNLIFLFQMNLRIKIKTADRPSGICMPAFSLLLYFTFYSERMARSLAKTVPLALVKSASRSSTVRFFFCSPETSMMTRPSWSIMRRFP